MLPFVYMLMTSFKSYGSVDQQHAVALAALRQRERPVPELRAGDPAIGFDRQSGTPLFVRYLANSSIVTAEHRARLAGHVGRWRRTRWRELDVPGKNLLFVFVLAVIMVPEDADAGPQGGHDVQPASWYNTYLALIVPFTGQRLRRSSCCASSSCRFPRICSRPRCMDGMGHLRYLISIVIPLSKPAMLTVALAELHLVLGQLQVAVAGHPRQQHARARRRLAAVQAGQGDTRSSC